MIGCPSRQDPSARRFSEQWLLAVEGELQKGDVVRHLLNSLGNRAVQILLFALDPIAMPSQFILAILDLLSVWVLLDVSSSSFWAVILVSNQLLQEFVVRAAGLRSLHRARRRKLGRGLGS